MAAVHPIAASLRRTTFATYPRSGHHFLIDCVADYFGTRRHGADSLACFGQTDLPYCEHYQCPRNLDCPEVSAPCPHGLPLQKTHDFNDDYPYTAERTVVQVREPARAIMSRYQLAMRRRGVAIDESLRPNWTQFAEQQTAYWLRFVGRWVFGPVADRLIVSYERLTTEPASLRAVLDHVTGEGVDIDPDRAANIHGTNVFTEGRPRGDDDFPITTVEIVNGIRERTHGIWRETRALSV